MSSRRRTKSGPAFHESAALYPGTFDPITNGHSDITARVARLFDRVVVAVAGSTRKKTMFPLKERVRLAEQALADISGLEVIGFHGLATSLARRMGIRVMIRGLRALSDFEYEFQLAGINRQIADEVETIFLTPANRYNFLSSSMVHELAHLQGDVQEWVHPKVAAALHRLHGKSAGRA